MTDANYDWNDLKALLAAEDAGSLSAAAAQTGWSQPTLGRRLDALEAALGQTLFTRGPRGLKLTEAGADLVEHAKKVEAAAGALSLAASGRRDLVQGTVRLTAPEFISAHHLPQILARLIDAEPGLEIELVASNDTQDLLRREADIAVRMFRPTQPGLITRKVAELPLGLYAGYDYIVRHGRPTLGDIGKHRMVGYDRSPLIREHVAQLGLEPPEGFFRIRTDDQVVYWRMVVEGAGIGATQRSIGDIEPRVARVLDELPLEPLPVWLTVHAELRTSAVIRTVYDYLADALGKLGGR